MAQHHRSEIEKRCGGEEEGRGAYLFGECEDVPV
jgi:hypothetical protein